MSNDPDLIEPELIDCAACDGYGFLREDEDDESTEEPCFDCAGQGVFER